MISVMYTCMLNYNSPKHCSLKQCQLKNNISKMCSLYQLYKQNRQYTNRWCLRTWCSNANVKFNRI